MADRSLLFDEEKPEEDRGSLPKAMGLAAVSSALKGIAAPAAEGLAALTDDGKDDGRNFWKGAARVTRRGADAVDAAIPAGRRADRDAALFPEKGQRSVFENPLSTLGMKLAEFGPVGAMYAATDGLAAATALGTAQGVYGRVSDVHGQVENMSDAELGQKYPVFDKYVNMGFSPKDARKLTIDDQLNPTSMTEAGLGGAAGGGLLGKVFHGAGGEGFVRTALGGAKHGAIGMGAMGAANELAAQTGDVEAGARAEYDPVGILRATGNSAAEGLALGAGGAGIAGGRRAAGNWGAKRLIEIANRENKRETNPTVTELPDDKAPAPDVSAATKAGEDTPTALDQQIANVPASTDALPTDATATAPSEAPVAPVAEVPPGVTKGKTKKTKTPSPAPTVEITPHETLDQIEAKVAKPEALSVEAAKEAVQAPSAKVEEAPVVPGEQPSEAAKALPDGLPAADPLEAISKQAAKVGTLPDIVKKWSADPDALHAELDHVREAARQAEVAIAKKYGVSVRNLSDAEDRMTPAEAHFIFHADDIGSTEQIDKITHELQPVDTLGEAATETSRVLKRLPQDMEKLSFSDELALTRLQVLKHEVERLGGNFPDVLKKAFENYAGRWRDMNDAEFMAKAAMDDLKKLHGAGFDLGANKAPLKIAPHETLDQIEAKIAPATPEAAPEAAPAPIVGKLTIKKPVTALQEKIAEATGVTPGGSTSVKVERVVKGNKVLEAKRERERAAENAKRRAAGESAILKGNSEAAETPEARDTRIAQEAKAALNERERTTKANSRFEAKHRDDNRAKAVVEDLWKDERGEVDEKGLGEAEAKALGGDAEAKASILTRAKNIVALAKERGAVKDRVGIDGKVIPVDRQRSRPSKIDLENKVQTPWISFVQEAARFVRKYEASDPTTPLRDANLNIVKGKTLHDELIQRYVSLERAMRSGDLSHADRIANNGEFTEARKEAAAKKAADGEGAGEKDFDANQKNAATRTNEVEQATHDKIDAGKASEDYEEPHAKGNTAVPVHDQAGLLKKAFATVHPENLKDVLARTLARAFPRTNDAMQVAQRLAGVRQRVFELTGDVKAHVVPDHVFDEHTTAAGLMYQPTEDAFGRGIKPVILLRESQARNPTVVLHEGVHAATSIAIDRSPSLKADIRAIMDDVLKGNEHLSEEYGFENEHEFIAEAMANPEFQTILQGIPVPKNIVTRWGIVRNAWDRFVGVVGKILGAKNRPELNALEAAMKIGGDAMDVQSAMYKGQREGSADYAAPHASKITEKAKEYWDEHRPSADNWRLRKQRFLDKLATVTQLANTSDHLFGPQQHARNLSELMGRMATEKDTLQRAKAEPLIRDMDKAQRKYDHGDGKTKSIWEQFSDFVHDETTAGVDATRPLEVKRDKKGNVLPTSKERWYGEAMHPELNTRWKELVRKAPELAGLRERMHDYFRETQNQQSLGLINNALKVLSSDGKGSPALAQRLFEGKATDADKKVLGGDGALKAILEANKLSKISGPYVPLMRRGEFVVQGRHHIETPTNAKRFSADDGTTPTPTPKGNIFEFGSRAEAESFVKKTLADKGLRPERVQRVNVDPKTGSKFGFDEDGTRRRLTKEETNTDEKWRVTANDSHVEFHETAQEAKRAKDELVKSGLQDVNHLDLKRTDAEEVNNKFLPQQIQNMLQAIEKRNSFKELGKDAQAALRRQLIEAGIASMGTTRAQSKRLPRRNVRGYSTELTKNAQQYASSAAGYIARLKFQPQIDKTLQAMSKYTDEQAKGYNKDNTDTLQLERRQRLKEFEKRIYNNAQPDPQGLLHDVTNRLLQMSFLDKLASPAFHMINGTEPWVVAAPVIAGRHGVFKAFGAIKDAYGTIGAGKMLGAGFKDTAKAFKDHADLTDYTKTMQDRVRSQPDGKYLSEVLQHLTDIGLLSRDAGLELARVVDPSGNMLGRALDHADLMARQLGASIESINRSVTAVAAYRLERAKGSSHEAALKYATEVVHDSMGDYSNWNAAPMFKSPIGRLALQFRKYGQRQYYLLGKTATAAFRGDREAMKTFAGLMATHMLFAGALGLPLEPIRIGMLAAGLLGVTDKKYEDLENGIRKGAANVLGATGGEIFTRGPARWLGFDLSNRINLDSLMTSGQDPKSMKDDDIWAYFAKNLAGAPASYLMDLKSGMAALARGDLVEASRLLVPLKVYADSVQAYQMATTGKQSDTGRQLMNPIRPDQAMVKMLGFTPTGVARQNEQTFAIKSQQHAFATKRQNMINHWVMATPGEKSAQYKLINEWNQTQPKNAQVTMSELTRTMQRRQAESTKQDYSKPGIRTTKRDRHIVDENNYFVNP